MFVGMSKRAHTCNQGNGVPSLFQSQKYILRCKQRQSICMKIKNEASAKTSKIRETKGLKMIIYAGNFRLKKMELVKNWMGMEPWS